MWEINLAEQTTAFLLFVALGVILCIIYDIFRSYRKVKVPSVISVFVQDVLFFVISSILTFLLLLATTYGQVRGYAFIGITLGFALCRISVSIILFKALVWLFNKIAVIIRAINTIFLRCFRACSEKFSIIANKLLKFLQNVVFYCKKLLHKNTYIVYNDCDLSNHE